MFELMQRLVAFKYSSKLNHWKTNSYAKHLLFDRLQEDIDDIVDGIAEKYFMANKKQDELKPELLKAEFIDKDLVKLCKDIKAHLEKIVKDGKVDEGIVSLLSGIEEAIDEKLALLTLE